jgi:hypothetical protein
MCSVTLMQVLWFRCIATYGTKIIMWYIFHVWKGNLVNWATITMCKTFFKNMKNIYNAQYKCLNGTRNLVHSNPCICKFYPNQSFFDFKYDCLSWHLVKTTSSHINDDKMVCSCICNLYLWLMSIWMKIKMKNTFLSSFFNDIPK